MNRLIDVYRVCLNPCKANVKVFCEGWEIDIRPLGLH
jgi:hypothetical protein